MMKRSLFQDVIPVQSDAILNVLTSRQHTRPHAPLVEVLRTVMEELHCCPEALARATRWLKLDPSQPIGRLRRTELIQLSKAVHRFWQQSAANSADAPAAQ